MTRLELCKERRRESVHVIGLSVIFVGVLLGALPQISDPVIILAGCAGLIYWERGLVFGVRSWQSCSRQIEAYAELKQLAGDPRLPADIREEAFRAVLIAEGEIR